MALLTRNNALVEVGYGAHLGGFVLGAAAGFTFRLFKPELCRATREESPW
jgi:membrane associated rhomboid family serine protease